MTRASRTAVIVAIPAAEAVVGAHRQRLDVAASWGVPAHVSVLYPFVDPSDLDDVVLARLAAAVASVASFECSFERCEWFGEDVLWLAPEPDRGFRALTTAVGSAFPDHPPYGGVFDDVVPHLTVGERRRAPLAELRAAERSVGAALPIRTRVGHADILAGAEAVDSWRSIGRLPLGPATGQG